MRQGGPGEACARMPSRHACRSDPPLQHSTIPLLFVTPRTHSQGSACCQAAPAARAPGGGTCCSTSANGNGHHAATPPRIAAASPRRVAVLYASGGGLARRLAEELAFAIRQAAGGPGPQGVEVTCACCGSVSDPDTFLLAPEGQRPDALLLVMATWQGGEPPDSARWFCR